MEGGRTSRSELNPWAWGVLSAALSTTFTMTDPMPAAASLDTSRAEKEGSERNERRWHVLRERQKVGDPQDHP